MCQPPDARTPSERTSLPSGNTAQAASPNNTHVDARNQSHPRAIPNTRTHQRRMRPRCTQRLTPALVSGSWVQCAKFRFGGILTPGRTSAWHLSPGEREKLMPHPRNTKALDWLRFTGSMREFVRGDHSPICSHLHSEAVAGQAADCAKRGGENHPQWIVVAMRSCSSSCLQRLWMPRSEHCVGLFCTRLD